jgi:hypothetical protein
MIPLYAALAMNTAALGLVRTGLDWSEMLIAAGNVVDKRSRMINSALRSPLTADYRELGKMVPEKVAAFGDAAEILVGAWAKWQKALTAQAQHLASGDALDCAKTGPDYRLIDAITRVFEAPGEALLPLHRAATENARRLEKAASHGR